MHYGYNAKYAGNKLVDVKTDHQQIVRMKTNSCLQKMTGRRSDRQIVRQVDSQLNSQISDYFNH